MLMQKMEINHLLRRNSTGSHSPGTLSDSTGHFINSRATLTTGMSATMRIDILVQFETV